MNGLASIQYSACKTYNRILKYFQREILQVSHMQSATLQEMHIVKYNLHISSITFVQQSLKYAPVGIEVHLKNKVFHKIPQENCHTFVMLSEVSPHEKKLWKCFLKLFPRCALRVIVLFKALINHCFITCIYSIVYFI